MGFADKTLYISIAIAYNLFIHNLASFTYKGLQYNTKVKRTAVLLFIAGTLAYLIAKFVLEDKQNSFNNPNVSYGLKIGGILLILTSFFSNWDNFGDEMKIMAVGAAFGYLVYYAYSNKDTEENEEDEDEEENKDLVDKVLKNIKK